MAQFRVSYKQTEYRHAVIEAEDEAAARAQWETAMGIWDVSMTDEFDMAENSELLGVDEL